MPCSIRLIMIFILKNNKLTSSDKIVGVLKFNGSNIVATPGSVDEGERVLNSLFESLRAHGKRRGRSEYILW